MVTIPIILLKRHRPLDMSCSRWFSYKIFFILSFVVVVLFHISINNDYIFLVARATTTIPTTTSTTEITEPIDTISEIDIDSSMIPTYDDANDDTNDDMNDSIENEETEFDEEGDENDEVEDEDDDTISLNLSETNLSSMNVDYSIMNDLIDEKEIIQNDILSDSVYTTTNEKYDDDSKTSNNTNINCESDDSTSCNDTISENVVDPKLSNITTPTTTKSQQHPNTIQFNNSSNFSSIGTNQEVGNMVDDDDDRSLLDIFGEVTKVYLTQQVIPPTDIDCRWDWRTIQCESSCHCSLQWKLGDYHLGRACRRRRRRQQQSSVQDGQQQEEEEIDDTNVCVPTIYIIDQPIPKRLLSLVHQTFDILRHTVHRLIQRMMQKVQYQYQTIQNYVCADLLSHLYVTIDGNQCWVLYPSSTTIFEKIFCRQYLYNNDISLCRQQTVATGSTTSN